MFLKHLECIWYLSWRCIKGKWVVIQKLRTHLIFGQLSFLNSPENWHNNNNLWLEEGNRVKLVINFCSTSGGEGTICMFCRAPESNLHSDSGFNFSTHLSGILTKSELINKRSLMVSLMHIMQTMFSSFMSDFNNFSQIFLN